MPTISNVGLMAERTLWKTWFCFIQTAITSYMSKV